MSSGQEDELHEESPQDLDLHELEEEYLRLRGELPPLGNADLRDTRAALAACQTWWDDWVEVIEAQESQSSALWRRLDALLANTRLLAQVGESLGLDATPLLRFVHDAEDFSFGHRKSLPPLPDDLRLLLDRLVLRLKARIESTPPPQSAEPEPKQPAVVLRGKGKPPVVLGKTKATLTVARYNVVQALLNAGEEGLSLNDLVTKSGHDDARKILKRLAESDPDWQAVIHLAGSTGKRYRIG